MEFAPRNPIARTLAVALLLFTAVSGYAGEAAPAPSRVAFEFALYFAPKPSADPEEELSRLVQTSSAGIVAATPEAGPDAITVEHRWSPIADYAPPSPESFKHFAKGLNEKDRGALAQAERVFIAVFSSPRSRVMAANRAACTLLADLAEKTGGAPWDEECRLLYSAKEWRAVRVATWQDDIPDMRAQVTMHAYRESELVRIITLGMRKFALPDLAIKDVPSHDSRAAGNLINACAQYLAEGARPKSRRLELDLSKIKHQDARQDALSNPLEGATGRALLEFKVIAGEDGDPQNQIWQPDFPECDGPTRTERLLQATARIFGSQDKTSRVAAGDPEMEAASERARRAFFAKAPVFRRGRAYNENLLVKAGFAVNGSTEYMWVEVTGWKENAIEGILVNDSDYDRSLRTGLRVTIEFPRIYDYIHYKSDGTEEGNETGKILLEREGKPRG